MGVSANNRCIHAHNLDKDLRNTSSQVRAVYFINDLFRIFMKELRVG